MYWLRHKDEAFESFKKYKFEVENIHDKRIKCLRSDRRGEYFSNESHRFCEENDSVHQCTTSYTS